MFRTCKLSVTKINLKLQGRRCYENELHNSSFGQRSYFLNYKMTYTFKNIVETRTTRLRCLNKSTAQRHQA